MIMTPAGLIPPLLTADLPGCGGIIRAKNEDFEVDEVPSYEPCGEGEHLYLWVEKRGMETLGEMEKDFPAIERWQK